MASPRNHFIWYLHPPLSCIIIVMHRCSKAKEDSKGVRKIGRIRISRPILHRCPKHLLKPIIVNIHDIEEKEALFTSKLALLILSTNPLTIPWVHCAPGKVAKIVSKFLKIISSSLTYSIPLKRRLTCWRVWRKSPWTSESGWSTWKTIFIYHFHSKADHKDFSYIYKYCLCLFVGRILWRADSVTTGISLSTSRVWQGKGGR